MLCRSSAFLFPNDARRDIGSWEQVTYAFLAYINRFVRPVISALGE